MTRALDDAHIEITDQGNVLSLKGNWVLNDIGQANTWVKKISQNESAIKSINASEIARMDTAGAYLLHTLQKRLKNPTIVGLQQNFQALLTLVTDELKEIHTAQVAQPHYNFLYLVGKKTLNVYQQILMMMAFLGEVFSVFFSLIWRPVKLQVRSIIHEIDMGGYRALPIIAVMMFLIGVVVAYQLGVQLQTYGANVYIIDLSGVAILREFSPLICSVIIAGRTSTSFAALIGTMKVNEEIDALHTMGLSPIERLVLPKMVALLIALPLLVVWGDIFGLLGSMVIAKTMAGINFHAFLERFRQEVAVKHLYLGLIKTPVLALIIAGIGCFQGFQAEGSAQSVGERTTKAAVQAIFLIILADAVFSILFNWMDI